MIQADIPYGPPTKVATVTLLMSPRTGRDVSALRVIHDGTNKTVIGGATAHPPRSHVVGHAGHDRQGGFRRRRLW